MSGKRRAKIMNFNLVFCAAWCVSALGQSSAPSETPKPAPYSPAKQECNAYFLGQQQGYSTKQIWCYYATQLFTPSATAGAAFWAELSQVQSSPPEWGQGTVGYAKRFGTNYAQAVTKQTGAFLTNLVLRNDPRMFPSPDKGGWRRTKHFILNIFTASPRAAPGQSLRFSPAWIIGSLGSGFIGNAWYPNSVSTVGDGLKRSGTALGGALGGSFYQEFGPDVLHLVQKLFTPKKPAPNSGS